MLLSVYAHFLVLGLVIINSKSAHLLWLPRDQWYRRYTYIFNKVLNLHCDLDLENNNLLFTQHTPAYDDVLSHYIWLQKDQQFRRHGRNSHIWLNEPSLWPWTWRQQTNLFAWHSGSWWCITIPSLVTEGAAAEEIMSRWTFTVILNLFCDLDLTTTE